MLAAVGLMVIRVVYWWWGDHFAVKGTLFRKDPELLPIVVADQVILFPLAA
jgi:hypothetical protein